MAGQPNAALEAAMNRLWQQFLPQMHERVDVLAAAAGSVAAGTLVAEQQRHAQAEAHKLSGALGTFGLSRGTELAHELEVVYGKPESPAPQLAEWLANLAGQLRAVVESR